MHKPVDEVLFEVRRLYAAGLYLQAFKAAQAHGPFSQWTDPAARTLAGRLAFVLGNSRLGMALHRSNARRHSQDSLAVYYGARAEFYRRGPWAVWKKFGQANIAEADDATLCADWNSYRAYLLAVMRDFEQAHAHLDRALELAPARPWTYVESSYVHEIEDRLDEALTLAEKSLAMQPWFRPGVQQVAHLCQVLNRHQDAMRLLEDAKSHIECGDVVLQLVELQVEHGQYTDAGENLSRASVLLPLADKYALRRMAMRQAEVSYYLGDEPASIEFALQSKASFFERVAANLKKASPIDRCVSLAVPFVRQQHLTCGPATLTAICRYWGQAADQLEITEAICYDGTPAHSERRWIEQNGCLAREFTVDWPTSMALVDRGVPFTLTTVEPTSAHLQAVVGYDARRGTFLIRDPSSASRSEMLAEGGLEYYESTGPRGLALVPVDQAERLAGLPLPDAALYDELYVLQQALERHDRKAAESAYRRLAAEAGDHYLTMHARRTLAGYDADRTTQLAVCQQMLTRFPDSGPLLFSKLGLMRSLSPRNERLEFLEQICQRKDIDPVFRLHLAEELIDDARSHPRAQKLLARLLWLRPGDARCYFALANVYWTARNLDRAIELYRFAACLDDRHEFCTKQYFIAARHVKQVDAAIRWLEDRVRRFGSKSSEPAQSLFWAYGELDRTDEAFLVLEEAISRRPDDDALRLFACDAYGRYGRFAAAERALGDVRRAHEGDRLRTAARLARYRGLLSESLISWRAVLEREPQAADAAAAVAELIAELEGGDAAREFLRRLIDRFPHNVELLRVVIDQWRDHDQEQTVRFVDRLLDLNPTEPWARRERAIALMRLQRLDAALAEADRAIALDESQSYGHSVRGDIISNAGNIAEAIHSYRRAIELSVDNDSALRGWLQICHFYADRAAALEFFYTELVRQTTFGGGLLAYHELARGVLQPETVLENLRAGLTARPDLWYAWSAVVRQLIDMRQLDEAKKLARQATGRFPLLPGAWIDVAEVCRVKNDAAGETTAIERAIEINPNWMTPVYRLIDVYERAGDLKQAKTAVEQALRRMPLDAVLHGYLADTRWRMNEREESILALERAVELDPGYQWAWETLQSHATELGQPVRAAEAARELVKSRPGEARGWHLLARMLAGVENREERLSAVRRAIELNPRWTEAHRLHSQLLCEAQRFDEALAACHPDALKNEAPCELSCQVAEVKYKQGHVAEAMGELRDLLTANVDFCAGWRQLADWCDYHSGQAQVPQMHLEAARALVRLAPHDPASWRHLGDAELAIGHRDVACDHFRYALTLAPQYLYVGLQLFDIQFANDQWQDAIDTLQTLETPDASPWVWARHVQWTVAMGMRKKMMLVLEKVCTAPSPDQSALSYALDRLPAGAWRRSAQTVLVRFLAEEHVWPEWIHLLLQQGAWFRARRALRLAPDHPRWADAAHYYLSAVAGANKRLTLASFIRRYRERLNAETRLWSMVGYALVHTHRFKAAIQWQANWRTRAGLEPWMLVNVVSALQRRRADAEAIAASQYALTLRADHTTTDHQLWLAAAAAQEGDFVHARQLLDDAELGGQEPYHKALRSLVRFTLDEAAKIQANPENYRVLGLLFRCRRAVRDYRVVFQGNSPLRRILAGCMRRLYLLCGRPKLARIMPFFAHFIAGL